MIIIMQQQICNFLLIARYQNTTKIASTWVSNDSILSLLSTEHFAQRALSLVWAEQSGSSDSGWEPALLCTWLPEAERKEVFVYESSGLSGWPASQAVSFNFSAGL